MAIQSRISSICDKLYVNRIILRWENTVPIRFFSEGSSSSSAPPPAPPPAHPSVASAPLVLKGDEMLKNIFLDVTQKFATAIGVLKKEKITIDPDDPTAVSRYATVMKMIREKAGLFSESQRIKYAIETQTKNIPDARTYLLMLKEVRIKQGLVDERGAEAMMMDALEKIEKKIKKPLMRDDKKGIDLLTVEFDKINEKLGIKRDELPKYEQDLELKIAKVQLEDLKKDAIEAMEIQKKKKEFKNEEIADVRSLDIRNFI